MKTCKLEYMLKSMNTTPKNELLGLIDIENDFTFQRFNTKLTEEYEEKTLVEDDDFNAFVYKKNKFQEYQEIFTRINEICIENKIFPIFNDPSNIEECLDLRVDLLRTIDDKTANEFFGTESFRKYNPPVYTKTIAYPVILEKERGGYNVTVPDIFGGVTCGYDYDSAIEMAKDMIKLMLKEAPGQCFSPKTLEETKKIFPNKLVVMVEVSLD